MRVFVTGATGFIGTALVRELIGAGHQVLGMTRSDAGAESLRKAGAEVHRGNLEDLESLRNGAAMSDGVIHTAFIHDFSKFQESVQVDRRAIETLGDALEGTGRPFLITSGTGGLNPGHISTEEDKGDPNSPVAARLQAEDLALAMVARGVGSRVIRLPQVHDPLKQGLVTYAVAIARQKGVSAYVGDGLNRWPAVHVTDAVRVYRLALEKGTAGTRYHAVGEEGVPVGEIAEVIGRKLNVPVVSMSSDEAAAHFGFLGYFVGADFPASSELTQKWLGWKPTGPRLMDDLEQGRFVEAAEAVMA